MVLESRITNYKIEGRVNMSEQERLKYEAIEQTYTYMMDRIDTSNYIEVQKVERYKQLMLLNQLCDEEIEMDGVKIIVENGSQVFIKQHPLLAEKLKINTQMIALEKSIKFEKDSAIKLEDAPAKKPKLKLI